MERPLKVTGVDISRIARGSALECSAVQDVLGVCETISSEQNHQGKVLLDRIVAMLMKMGGRSYSVKESEIAYYLGNDDNDPIAIPMPMKSQTNKYL